MSNLSPEPHIGQILTVLVDRQEELSPNRTQARRVIGARLAEKANRRAPWTYNNIQLIESGHHRPKSGSHIYHAILSLWYESDPNREEEFYTVEVRVPTGYHIHPGAILRRNSRLCSRPGCGNYYSPGPRQTYCSSYCRRLDKK